MTGKHCPSCAINQRVFYCLVSISWMNLITSPQWQANTALHVLSTREFSIAWYQSAEWISLPAYNDISLQPVQRQANTARHVISTREYSIPWYPSAEWISLLAYKGRQTLPVMCYQPESILLLGINQLNESHYQPTMTGKHWYPQFISVVQTPFLHDNVFWNRCLHTTSSSSCSGSSGGSSRVFLVVICSQIAWLFMTLEMDSTSKTHLARSDSGCSSLSVPLGFLLSTFCFCQRLKCFAVCKESSVLMLNSSLKD